MEIAVKIKNSSTNWNENLRPRVGQVVQHNGNYFQNTNGRNHIPQIGEDNGWVYIGLVNPINQTNLKIISKAEGNTGPNIENGDVACGLLDDGITFIPFGVYLGNINGNEYQNIENWKTNPIQF